MPRMLSVLPSTHARSHDSLAHGFLVAAGGKIDAAVKENLNYLACIKKSVKAASRRKNARFAS